MAGSCPRQPGEGCYIAVCPTSGTAGPPPSPAKLAPLFLIPCTPWPLLGSDLETLCQPSHFPQPLLASSQHTCPPIALTSCLAWNVQKAGTTTPTPHHLSLESLVPLVRCYFPALVGLLMATKVILLITSI